MASNTTHASCSAWLRSQWRNPNDVFTILLIIGGDVVQVAIAQLCGGPFQGITPVVFSFGWVTYAVSALRSAVGEMTLMPKPELDCMVINAKNGYKRHNCSWVLARILRDFDHWKDTDCDRVEEEKRTHLRAAHVKSGKPRDSARVALRVIVWRCIDAYGKPKADWLYWAGFPVAVLQLGIAAIPWAVSGEWLIFLITGAGTFLAFSSGGLPKWHTEKFGVRHLTQHEEPKDVFLTQGNGSHEALLILGCQDGMDLEALASPHRDKKRHELTRPLSVLLAVLWIALLITVAGYELSTWYLLAVGMLGMLHNVAVAGMPRMPQAFGIALQYTGQTFVEGKVMAVLWAVEQELPGAGAALMPEFFSGTLWPREKLLWAYAERRHGAHRSEKKKAISPAAHQPTLWALPPLRRPSSLFDDSDVPENGEYRASQGSAMPALSTTARHTAVGAHHNGKVGDHVVQIQ